MVNAFALAIFDTVDAHFSEEWLANIKNVLGDAKPDYLMHLPQPRQCHLLQDL